MNNLRELHREAMHLADIAFSLQKRGIIEKANDFFFRAYEIELKVASESKKEPSRSILYRSAATLALQAGLFREAEQAAALGLSGQPPDEIAAELRDVFERVNFRRHLSLAGLSLDPNEFQMSISGEAIAPGMALFNDVFSRVQPLQTLVTRVAQQLNNRKFGRLTKSSDNYRLFMAPPRTGSFALTLRIGTPNQDMLPEIDDRKRIIEELFYNLSLINEGRVDELRQKIDDVQYFTNFMGVAKQLAPDGTRVKLVGLSAITVTAQQQQKEVSVAFSIPQKAIKLTLDELEQSVAPDADKQIRVIEGKLFYGDGLKNNVKIVDDGGKIHPIRVNEAIAEDVVRPYFGERVSVEVIEVKKTLMLRNITSLDA